MLGRARWVALALLVGTWAQAKPERFWTDAQEESLRESHSILGRVAHDALPAVVSITTVDAPPKGKSKNPTEEPQKGIGSGFIISPDGYVLTCSHVIEDAADIRVSITSPEGFSEDYPARVVGNDPQTDFALLKVDVPRKLPVLKLGSARDVEIADWVVVIGSPFGLAHSVSVGVVSFKGRTEVTPNGRDGYYDYLQTDASINPGNSGGPILDVHGDVIAVANAVNVAGQGIGFAVPVDIAKAVLPDLRAFGQVHRGWMGISVEDITPEVAKTLGVPSYQGVLVAEVAEDGPAARAGIHTGDLILSLSHERIRRSQDMRWRVATTEVGQQLELTLERNGRPVTVGVRLEAPPKVQAQAQKDEPDESQEAMGAEIADVDTAASARAGLASPVGALIQKLDPKSPLMAAGLASGDVVLKMNDAEISGGDALSQALEDTPSGQLIRMFVRRGPQTLVLAFRKP